MTTEKFYGYEILAMEVLMLDHGKFCCDFEHGDFLVMILSMENFFGHVILVVAFFFLLSMENFVVTILVVEIFLLGM